MPPVPQFATKSSPKTFKTALNRLGSDTAFRNQVLKSPTVLTKEFHLSIQELSALRHVAQLSGADMTQINKARAAGIGAFRAGAAEIDIDVSCCCCCCCGETAVLRYAKKAVLATA
jgi:hypothetical protein